MSNGKKLTGYPCAFQVLKATLPPDAWAAVLEEMQPIGFTDDERPVFAHSAASMSRGFEAWMKGDFGVTPRQVPSHQSVMTHRRGGCVRCGSL